MLTHGASAPAATASTSDDNDVKVPEHFQAAAAHASVVNASCSSVLQPHARKRLRAAGTPMPSKVRPGVITRTGPAPNQSNRKCPAMPPCTVTCSFCNRRGHTGEKCWDKFNFLCSETIATDVISTNGTSPKHAVSCQSLTATSKMKPAKNAICSFCNRRGHLSPKCWNKHPAQKPAHIFLSNGKLAVPDPSKMALVQSVSTSASSVCPKDVNPTRAPVIAHVGTAVVSSPSSDIPK